MTLLPPNATRLERGLENGVSRISELAAPIDTLVDPQTIPADVLPWLAFGLSVDSWNPSWSDAVKRRAVADSIALHRIKGTRFSVETVLARMDDLATVIEWHEDEARLAPHTFEVLIPLVITPGAAGGERARAGIVDEIIAEVGKVKPLREHLTVVQSLMLEGGVGIQGAARLATYRRDDADLAIDTSERWNFYLQTEVGEPLQAEAGTLLDTAQ